MQLRLRPRSSSGTLIGKHVLKIILFILVFFIAIFLLDKIEMPAPNKLIKHEIGNDKLITVK
tara:strand:+ start:52 stop:237 length:186 start_codon:yes stop_codon:yes gene_type:complete